MPKQEPRPTVKPSALSKHPPSSEAGTPYSSSGGEAQVSPSAGQTNVVGGLADGPADGEAEGVDDGLEDGEAEGEDEGSAEGEAEGEAEGDEEGSAEGEAEGAEEGLADGEAEGVEEGASDGLLLGVAEGLALGEALGTSEGEAEGVQDGAAEGTVQSVMQFRLQSPISFFCLVALHSLVQALIHSPSGSVFFPVSSRGPCPPTPPRRSLVDSSSSSARIPISAAS